MNERIACTNLMVKLTLHKMIHQLSSTNMNVTLSDILSSRLRLYSWSIDMNTLPSQNAVKCIVDMEKGNLQVVPYFINFSRYHNSS